MNHTIPNLTAAMRSQCPRGMGADCACAARIEARLEAGQSEAAILATHARRSAMFSLGTFGPLIAAALHQLTRRPATRSRLNLDHWESAKTEDGGTATEATTRERFDLDAFLANIAAEADGGGGGFDDLPPIGDTPRRTAARADKPICEHREPVTA